MLGGGKGGGGWVDFAIHVLLSVYERMHAHRYIRLYYEKKFKGLFLLFSPTLSHNSVM